MPISNKLKDGISASSWATRMFDRIGAKEAYDLTLGNPQIEPPPEFFEQLKQIVNNPSPGMHGYTPISGYPETKEAVARTLAKETGIPFSEQHIIMTAGATGGLNIILKTILNPGEEVIVLAPHFVEYPYYIDNHGGICKVVESNPDFTLNIENIATRINAATAAIIINSPNNPTGHVYSEQNLLDLAELLNEKNKELKKTIILVSDEAYRSIVYGDTILPNIFKIYPNTIAAFSYSKTLSIPGERIGYVAIHPEIIMDKEIIEGIKFANRILGYLNAPAIMQHVIARLQGICVNIEEYRERRDIFCNALQEFGYSFVKPSGAYYIFPKSPVDDIVFAQELSKKGVFVNPGTWFGRSGHFRIAYCVKKEVIEKSLDIFREVRNLVTGK